MGNYKYIWQGLSYFKSYWHKLLLIFILSIINISLSIVPIEVMRRLIDEAIPNKDLRLVVIMVIIVFFTHLLLLLIGYIQDLMVTKIGQNVTKKIRVDFFSKLVSLPKKYSAKFKTGQLMERMIDDSDEVVDSIFDLVISPILDIISLLVTIVYMFIVSPKLTFVSLSFIPLFVLMTLPVNNLVRKKYSLIKKKWASIYSTIETKLEMLSKIKNKKQAKKEENYLDQKLRAYNKVEYNYERFSARFESIASIIGDIAPYTILIYATYLIIGGTLDIGTLIAFSILTPKLFGPTQELVGQELEFQALEITAKRVFEIMDKK